MTEQERKQLFDQWDEIATLVGRVSVDEITDAGEVYMKTECGRRFIVKEAPQRPEVK